MSSPARTASTEAGPWVVIAVEKASQGRIAPGGRLSKSKASFKVLWMSIAAMTPCHALLGGVPLAAIARYQSQGSDLSSSAVAVLPGSGCPPLPGLLSAP